jgi:hypothetical protein
MEYVFLFVVEGATVDDIEIVDLLSERLDAMLARGGGVDLLDIAVEGENAFDAAMTASRSVKELVPQLRLLRLDRELVGVQDIADRVGKTRQAVHQWLWTEVNEWLERIGYGDGANRPNRYEMAEIDAALHNNLDDKTDLSTARFLRNLRIGATASPVEARWGVAAGEIARSGSTARAVSTGLLVDVDFVGFAGTLPLLTQHLAGRHNASSAFEPETRTGVAHEA